MTRPRIKSGAGSRRVEVSLEEIGPGLPLVRVEGYGTVELYLFRSPDDGRWHSLWPLPGGVCRLAANWCAAPELPALVPILEANT